MMFGRRLSGKVDLSNNPFYPSTIKREDDDEIKAYNDHLKSEEFYKPPIDEFLNSRLVPMTDTVVVLINFSIIAKGQLEGQFIPCEMALSAFSLTDGIIDNCVVYIRHSDKTVNPFEMQLKMRILNIPPLQPADKGKSNYTEAYTTLQLFRDKFPYKANDVFQKAPLFCRRSEYDEVAGCLDFLYGSVRDRFGFHILPLEYLIYRMSTEICLEDLKNHKSIQYPYDENCARDILDCNNYSKLTQLACTHHCKNTQGFCYCPLKIINVYAYNIIATLCDLKIALPGSHIPSKDGEKLESTRRQKQILAWKTNPLCRKAMSILVKANNRL